MIFKTLNFLVVLLFLNSRLLYGVNSTPVSSSSSLEGDKPPTSDFVKFTKANIEHESVNRCDDFYSYACGNWNKNPMIPEKIINSSASDLAQFKLDMLIEEFLKNSTNSDDNTAEGKAKKFYLSCNKENNVLNSMTPIINLEIKKKSGLDIINMDWTDVNFVFDKYGVNPFLKLEILQKKGSEKKEVSLKYPEREWYSRFVNLLKTEKSGAGTLFLLLISSVQPFHSHLKKLSENKKEPVTQTYGAFLAANNQTDGFDWPRYFDLASNGEIDETWIIHDHLGNFSEYNELLSDTNKIILGKYGMINFMTDFADMFKDDFDETDRKHCIRLVKTHFGSALMPWLIEKLSLAEWREDINKVINRVKDAFALRVNNNFWLDEQTKSGAKAKLTAMQFTVGYTDEMSNRAEQDNAYNSVNISDDFWENLLSLKEKEISDSRKGIFYPKEAFAEAKYFPEMNLVSIPLRYTQMPFYDKSYTDLMKLGGLGFVIGKKMAASVDTDNYQLNGKGEKENWWTEGSWKNYTKRNECMKSQIEGMTYKNITLANDRVTMAEIVVNDLGARIAQDAYFKLMEEEGNGDAKLHEGLDFNNRELYFVQFGQTNCIGNFAENKTLPAVEPFRVNGVLRNKPEFSAAFQCSLGSYLNTETKCP